MAHPVDRDILKLLAKNNKAEALRRLRARTGLGEQEAKALLDAVDRAKQAVGGMKEAIGGMKQAAGGIKQSAGEIKQAVHDTKHVFANTHSPTLSESHGIIQRPGLAPGEVPAPGNQLLKMTIVILIIAAAIWYLMQPTTRIW